MQYKAIRRAKGRQRGMALVTTMLVLMGVMTIMLLGVLAGGSRSSNSGVMTSTGNAMQMSSARMQATAAFNLAESGVEYTLQWFHVQASPPASTRAFAPGDSALSAALVGTSLSAWGATYSGTPRRATVNFASGSFSVLIYPDANNSDPNNNQKKYLVESVGTSGGYNQIVQAYVQQVSFGKYAYFTNIDPGNGYWVCGMNLFDGPMHSNNADGVPTNFIWYNAAGAAPMFNPDGSYECSASSINWNLNYIGNRTAPAGGDWTKVAAGGASAVQTGAPQIPLPTASTLQHDAALAGTAPPASIGVAVPVSRGATSGGIYIHGDVQQMTLSVRNSVDQVITIQQTDSNGKPLTTTITLSATTGKTWVHTDYFQPIGNTGIYLENTTDTSQNGLTNGVIYCDGNIGGQTGTKTGGLAGQIADNRYDASGNLSNFSGLTIATDAGKNLNIDGSLTYNTARQKYTSGDTIPPGYQVGDYKPEAADTNFSKNAGTLGLVSKTIEVVDKDASGNALTNVEVDATVMAYNSYDATDTATRPKGTFLNMGGYIANTGGSFGVINNNGVLLTGLAENYHYDARLANNPPPFFPTTGNMYDILSWQRTAHTLDGWL